MPADGWRILPLAEVADLDVGHAFRSQWFSDHDGVRLLRGENVGYGSADWSATKRLPAALAKDFDDYLLRLGDVVIGMDRTFTKSGVKVSLLTDQDLPALLVQRVGRFVPTRTESGYLHQLLRWPSFHQALLGRQKGMDIPHLSKSEILSPLVPCPPLPEQRQIAEILDTLDEAIRKTDEIIAKLKQVKQGLLHDLLTRGIDDNGKLRDPLRHPEQFKDSPLGRIPKGWEVAPLRALFSDIYRYPTYYGIDYVETGVPEVRGELLNADGTVSSDRAAYRHITERTACRFPRVRLTEDDFVMSVRGTLGKIARVPAWLAGAVITANLIKFSFDRQRVVPGWVAHYLLAPKFQADLDLASSATTIKTIQVPALAAIRLPVPGVREQQGVAAGLNTLDRRLQVEGEERAKLLLAKQGLMEDLLTGRVRVTKLLEDAAE